MLGLKNLNLNKLTTAFMVVSAAMMIFAAAAPAASASTTMLFIEIICALVLIGVWIAVAVEIYKRFFGGQSPYRAPVRLMIASNAAPGSPKTSAEAVR